MQSPCLCAVFSGASTALTPQEASDFLRSLPRAEGYASLLHPIECMPRWARVQESWTNIWAYDELRVMLTGVPCPTRARAEEEARQVGRQRRRLGVRLACRVHTVPRTPTNSDADS